MRRDVSGWLKRKLEMDRASVDEMKAYDDIADMKWNLPAGLSRLNYAVKYVDPIGHDAEKTATNFFDTYQPKIDILPRGPEDKEKAEELERFLEWHMMRANQHGETQPFRTMLKHSVRYNRICAQLDYLPYWLSRDRASWTDEQREAIASSPFCIYVHDPKNVHYEMGPYGLSKVAIISNSSAADVVTHWEIYPGVNLDKLNEWLVLDPLARVILVDYMDMKSRYVFCWRTTSSLEADAAAPRQEEILDGNQNHLVVEIYNKPNTLGFINWVVATGSSDALFATLHRGDLWVNANRTQSIMLSDLYRRAFYPMGIEEGSGEELEIDYTGDAWTVKVPPGKKLTPIQRPPIDPGWSQASVEAKGVMASSLGVQTLSGIEPKSNVQFATINAFIDLSKTTLQPFIRTTEKGLVSICGMVFKWLRLMGESEVGRRLYDGGNGKVAGTKITVAPGTFSPESLFITVKLLEDTRTGKLQLTNEISQIMQAGLKVPSSHFVEQLGYGDPDANKQAWEEEQMDNLALKMTSMKKELELQIEGKKAELELMMKIQGAAGGGSSPPPAPTNGIPGGQGFNPAAGGAPPATAAPSATRTQLPE